RAHPLSFSSPNPNPQIPPLHLIQGRGKDQIGVGRAPLHDSLPGVPWIRVLRARRSSSKVFWLVMVDLSFYMILGDSLWSKTSKGLPELVSRGVLELVGYFRRAKSLAFSLGRTGLTGQRDRSDRYGFGDSG